eukprot:2048660-Rhodomonas_salina.1
MHKALAVAIGVLLSLRIVGAYHTARHSLYTETKKILHKKCDSIPKLYGVGPLNIEHVVPASILRRAESTIPVHFCIADPHNLHLASSGLNSIRSNYRFSLRPPTPEMQPLGGCNFVSERKRLFVPRTSDWGCI